MQKVLILGSTGLIGTYLLNEFNKPENKDKYELITPTRNELDMLYWDDNKNMDYIKTIMPDIIINTVAAHNISNKEIMDKAFQYNVHALYWLLGALNTMSKPYVFVNYSTDYVFGGQQWLLHRNAAYDSEETTANGLYGLTKALGEKVVANVCNFTYYNIRVAGVYGSVQSKQKGGNFVLNLIKRANEGTKEITMRQDVVSNQTYAEDIAKYTIKLLNSELASGEYNCTNEYEVSWYDFAKMVNEIFKLGLKIIPVTDAKIDIDRPNYTCMKTELQSSWLTRGPYDGLLALKKEMDGVEK